MKGVHITIFYGYRYHDEEYDIDKTGWDYERINSHTTHTGYAHTLSTYLSKTRQYTHELLNRLRT